MDGLPKDQDMDQAEGEANINISVHILVRGLSINLDIIHVPQCTFSC